MGALDDIRAALRPLKDRGLVHSVWHGARPITHPGGPMGHGDPVVVHLNIEEGTNPESFRDEIEAAIKRAGIGTATLILRRRSTCP